MGTDSLGREFKSLWNWGEGAIWVGSSTTSGDEGISSPTGVTALSISAEHSHSLRIFKFKQACPQSENPNWKFKAVFVLSAPKTEKGAGFKGHDLLVHQSQCGMRHSQEARLMRNKWEREKERERKESQHNVRDWVFMTGSLSLWLI